MPISLLHRHFPERPHNVIMFVQVIIWYFRNLKQSEGQFIPEALWWFTMLMSHSHFTRAGIEGPLDSLHMSINVKITFLYLDAQGLAYIDWPEVKNQGKWKMTRTGSKLDLIWLLEETWWPEVDEFTLQNEAPGSSANQGSESQIGSMPGFDKYQQ